MRTIYKYTDEAKKEINEKALKSNKVILTTEKTYIDSKGNLVILLGLPITKKNQ